MPIPTPVVTIATYGNYKLMEDNLFNYYRKRSAKARLGLL